MRNLAVLIAVIAVVAVAVLAVRVLGIGVTPMMPGPPY
jgi:hypothetical protein